MRKLIELSNGYRFEYMAASGALGFNGQGWPWEKPFKYLGLLDPSLFMVVTKTLTPNSEEGNLKWWAPWKSIKFIPNGVVNAVSLSNPGLNWWIEKIGPKVNKDRIPLVVSIFSSGAVMLIKMAKRLSKFDIVGVEINAMCPNIRVSLREREIIEACQGIKRKVGLPVILKLAVDSEINISSLEGLVEAISVNSVPWRIVFPDKRSPLAHLGNGGISGKIAQPFVWDFLRRLVEKTSIPVIGPSIWDFDDIENVRKLGAKAVSFGSVFLRYPWRPTKFVKKDLKRK